jgi:broad specificity phosphatase PhoE
LIYDLKSAVKAARFTLLLSLAGCASVAVPVRQQGETVAYVVRHAEKATSAQSVPDPDLSADGRRRAQMLADRLGQAGITLIIVTDLKRTGQTASPLATRLKIVPETISVRLPNHTDSVAATVLHHHGESILVVGHTNTVPAIIAALGGPKLANLCDSEYSDLFVVTIPVSGATKVDFLHYGAADQVDPTCEFPTR